MTPDEALMLAKVAASQDRLVYTQHAKQERMPARGLLPDDVRRAVMTAARARPDPPSDTKYRFEGGVDVDGDAVVAVVGVFVPDGVRVITVF